MSKNILENDILDKIKVSNRAQIPKQLRAEVIVLLAKGKSMRAIAQEVGINLSTVLKIKKSNKELIAQIQTMIGVETLEREEKIIFKATNLLMKKLDRLEDSNDKLDSIKTTELSSMIKDIFQKLQIEQNKPTEIHSKYYGMSEEEQRQELLESIERIKRGDLLEMKNHIFGE